MDAPQLPGAEASADPAGGQPPGQASAFRRALDSQVEPPEPSMALVPTGRYDHTSPINVAVLRTLLASGKPSGPDAPSVPDTVPTSPSTADAGAPPFFPAPAAAPAPLPVPATPPSANGPAVVAPAVSAPALRGPTTIAPTTSAAPPSAPATFAGVPAMAGPPATPAPSAAGSDSGNNGGNEPPAPEPSPRHNAKPSWLRSAVWISALLGACAGTALVLFNIGHSPDPLAPTALPTKAATHSLSPQRAAPKPSHKPKPSPSPSPSHASASPSHSPSPSPSPSPSHPSASPSPSVTATASAQAGFVTIVWTYTYDARVADIQNRLARLGYMAPVQNNQYVDSYRTMRQAGWRPPPDAAGYYQVATEMAVRAFKFDYLQHDQGLLPDPSCDARTYQALVTATG